jgi:hypothetical protein
VARFLAGLLLVLGACSGTRFTGEAAEAGSDDGGGATDGGGSGDGAASADAGTPCSWSATGNTCGQNQYCDAPGCTKGFCRTTPRTAVTDLNPVCGCDHQTYWNEGVARVHGMSLLNGNSGCESAAKVCTSNQQCVNGGSCNIHVQLGQCASNASGVCWVVPDTCPSPGLSPKTRECLATQCAGMCDLIKNGKPWSDDPTCQ